MEKIQVAVLCQS